MFRSAIIKLTNFCNLDCTYCYMFNQEDKTFQRVPKRMPLSYALKFIDRIDDYCQQNHIPEFSLILHGGEPTLWPVQSFRTFFDKIDKVETVIKVSIQTNAFKINWELFRLLADNNVSIGISIDGPKEINDKFRMDHRKKGSYDKIMNNVGKLIDNGFGNTIGGFLTVVDPKSDPSQFLNWVKSLPIKKVNILWPIEFNHDNPPWRFFGQSQMEYMELPVYGNWFKRLFDQWYREDEPSVYIRHFFELITLIMGAKQHTDSLVNDQLNMFVVNSNGDYEYHDYFRSYKDGGTKTPFNVNDHGIDSLHGDAVFQKLLNLIDHQPLACRGCEVRSLCGGGFLPGRLNAATGISLRNKSILCYDHHYFFTHVRDTIMTSLSQSLQNIRPPMTALA